MIREPNGDNSPLARIATLEGQILAHDAELATLGRKVDALLSDERRRDVTLGQQGVLLTKIAKKVGVPREDVDSLYPPSSEDSVIRRLDDLKKQLEADRKDRKRRGRSKTDWAKLVGMIVGAILVLASAVRGLVETVKQVGGGPAPAPAPAMTSHP